MFHEMCVCLCVCARVCSKSIQLYIFYKVADRAQYTKWQQVPKHGRMTYGALYTE